MSKPVGQALHFAVAQLPFAQGKAKGAWVLIRLVLKQLMHTVAAGKLGAAGIETHEYGVAVAGSQERQVVDACIWLLESRQDVRLQ